MQIEFSQIAKQTLRDIIEFLEENWTNREIVTFLFDVKRVTNELKNGKYRQFQKSSSNTRSVLIGKKHIRMYFRMEEHTIKVLLFFDVRQDPQKIIDLLK